MDDLQEETVSEPLFVSPAEAARLLGLSRGEIYRRLTTGDLTARKRGRRTLIEVDSIRRFSEALPKWKPGE